MNLPEFQPVCFGPNGGRVNPPINIVATCLLLLGIITGTPGEPRPVQSAGLKGLE